ncbi:MAG: hypothetical protein ACRCYX_12595 [Dermatophilaceae bacterium]
MTARRRLATLLPPDLDQRMRATVIGMQAHDRLYTLTQFITDAIEAHCQHLEAERHHGEPWTVPTTPLTRGPRLSDRG